MRAGTLVRELDWSTASGKHVTVRTCRLVSLEHRHVAAITYDVVVHDRPAPLVISSELLDRQDAGLGAAPEPGAVADPRRGARLTGRVLEPVVGRGRRPAPRATATGPANSRMTLGVGVDHLVETQAPLQTRNSVDDDGGAVVVSVDAQPGVPIRVTKFVAYQTSREVPPRELAERCGRTLDRVRRDGIEALLATQRANLDHFWDRADVRVDCGTRSARTQQAIRWNLFQLAQATGRVEGAGVPAKGLTRQAYEGHYFWDMEIYLIPFLALHAPADRAQPAELPPLHARAARASARASSASAARCSPGARSAARRLGELRGRHRAVPHQRGHRVRDPELRRRPRRRGLPRRGRRRDPRRDRPALVRPRLLLRRRRVPHPRRDRARRVHDGRQQQRVHEPDGAGEPLVRRGDDPAARGRPARRVHAALVHELELEPRGGRPSGSGPPPRCTSRSTSGAGSTRRTSSFLEREVWDLNARRPRTSRCCCTTTRSSSTATR